MSSSLIYTNIAHRPVRISSFGSLSHFRSSNKPVGATSRCLDCPAAAVCPYDAKKIYIDSKKSGVAHGNMVRGLLN